MLFVYMRLELIFRGESFHTEATLEVILVGVMPLMFGHRTLGGEATATEATGEWIDPTVAVHVQTISTL